MALSGWREEAISRQHDRESFDCGVSDLNDYLRRYARQNHRSGGAKTFVAVPRENTKRILGYYTLSPGAVEFAQAPETLRRGLGRYDVPVFRLGRLAVDISVQGQALGGQLLMSAGVRCLAVAQEVGGVALAIDAKDERAAAWYQQFGALPLADSPLKLVLPLDVVASVQTRDDRD